MGAADGLDRLVRRLSLRTRAAERRAGRLLVLVAAAGVLLSLLGTIVGWQVVGGLDGASRTSLDVTLEALTSIEDTVDLADTVLRSTTTTLDDVQRTLDTVASSFATSNEVLGAIDGLTQTAAPTLDTTVRAVRQLATVGASIDTLLQQLRSVPLLPSVTPAAALGPPIAAIADGLQPLPAALRSTTDALARLRGSSVQLEADLRTLSASVATVRSTLVGTGPLIDRYHLDVDRAQQVASDARTQLSSGAWRLRLLLVLAGITLAFGQLVPFWFGSELLARSDRDAHSEGDLAVGAVGLRDDGAPRG